MNTSLNDWANAYKPSTLCWRTTMKKLYHLHAFRQHKPTDIHNTSYDESKSSHDTDASNTGANRFGYLPLNKTHERRDKADFDNDAQELDFNCDVYGDGSMDVW